MNERILITYGTRAHSTEEVAQRIGDVLRERGAEVDVRDIVTVTNLRPYTAVVIGTAIRVGKPLSEVQQFVERHQLALSNMPVAYFAVCMTLREDTPAHREAVERYLDPLRAFVEPVAIGLFAGRLDPQQTPLGMRLVLKLMRIPPGDWRDWEAIHAWAESLADLLLAEPLPAAP